MHYICKLSKNNLNSFINNFIYNKIDRKNIFIPPVNLVIYLKIKYINIQK